MIGHRFCSVPVSLWLGVLISPIAPKSMCRICVDHTQLLRAVAVCKLPSQTNQLVIWQPISGPQLLKFSVLESRNFSLGDVEICWSVTRCHLKNHKPCLWDHILTQRRRGHRLRPTTSKEDNTFLHIMSGGGHVSFRIHDQGEADQAN